MTRKASLSGLEAISISDKLTFDTSILKCNTIEEVWRLIGEQSECFLKIFDAYRDDIEIPVLDIQQYMHYFHNMVGMSVQCPNCKTIVL